MKAVRDKLIFVSSESGQLSENMWIKVLSKQQLKKKYVQTTYQKNLISLPLPSSIPYPIPRLPLAYLSLPLFLSPSLPLSLPPSLPPSLFLLTTLSLSSSPSSLLMHYQYISILTSSDIKLAIDSHMICSVRDFCYPVILLVQVPLIIQLPFPLENTGLCGDGYRPAVVSHFYTVRKFRKIQTALTLTHQDSMVARDLIVLFAVEGNVH